MRSIILPFLFCLTVWSVALPQNSAPTQLSVDASSAAPGRLITVKVLNAPADTKFASFDLSPLIRGLLLSNKGNGTWEGSFAVLPSMAGQVLRPEAQLFDANRQAVSVKANGVAIEIETAASEQPGMIAETKEGRTAIAFDDTVRLDTIEIRSSGKSESFSPEMKNNYLLLPPSLAKSEIVTVTALNIRGEKVTLRGPASDAVGAR